MSADVTDARIRTVPANIWLALAGDLATKAAAFAVVAVCAHFLSVDQFARLGVALAVLTVATSLLDAGFSTLIVRDGARRPAETMALLRASLRVRAPVAALVVAAGLVGGLYAGGVWLGLLTAVAAVAGAALLSLTSVFRSAQDLAPEAVQKSAAAALTLLGAAICAIEVPRAVAVVGALGAAMWLSVPALWLLARRRFRGEGSAPATSVLRGALPFGLMALATLLYYRLGTLLLGAVGTRSDTALYTVASTVAFGLLMVPNAITTGLLPRLSAQGLGPGGLRTARRALGWTLLSSVLLCAAAGGLAPWALRYGFGARYEGALTPLLVLLVGIVVIGANGVFGTVLITLGRTSILGFQVAASLVVNVGVGLALVPRFGTDGAAAATLVTELVALAILVVAVHRAVPELLRPAGLALRGRWLPSDTPFAAHDVRQGSGP